MTGFRAEKREAVRRWPLWGKLGFKSRIVVSVMLPSMISSKELIESLAESGIRVEIVAGETVTKPIITRDGQYYVEFRFDESCYQSVCARMDDMGWGWTRVF